MKGVLDRLSYEDGNLYWTKVISNAIKVGQTLSRNTNLLNESNT